MGLIKTALAAFLLLNFVATAQQYVISTYAGGGVPPVKPIQALQATLSGPAALATDGAGNLYFSNGNAIFRLDTGGTTTRIAGNGNAGFSGDGGPATAARLQISTPGELFGQGLGVDRSGNVFIGDIGNHRIRKVSADGIITTVAGNGVPGSSGDGGPATEAELGEPSGVAIYAGNLYIADLTYNVVRKVSPAGIITTVAGIASMEPGFSGDGGPATSAKLAIPWTIALDLNGNLFIADSLNHRIRKVSTDGTITTVAGNDTRAQYGAGAEDSGPATSITLDSPSGLAVDDMGNLFISDGSFPIIRKVTPDGMLTPVVGNGTYGFSGDGGPAGKAQLASPWGLALDSRNNLFISDFGNLRIREVLASGTINTVAGGGAIDLLEVSGDITLATDAHLNLAISGLGVQSGLATDSNGNVFFAETGSGLIRKISPNGQMITVAGGAACPDPNACPLGDGGLATNVSFRYPAGVAVDGKGNLFIADSSNSRVRKVSPDGIITTAAGNGTYGSTGDGGLATTAQIIVQSVAADSAGNIFIAEGSRVRRVSSAGIITTVAGGGDCAGPSCDGGPALNASISANAVALDTVGNLLVADNGTDDFGCYFYIRKVSADGIIRTLAGAAGPCGASGDGGPATAATLNFASSVAVDGAGNVFLTDYNSQRIRRISTDGIITTVAGGQYGYSGDGGPAVNAAVNYPIAVAADASGNVYFSDAFNEVIRVLRPYTHPLLSAVVDAASQRPDPVTPGKIVVIYGARLGPASLAQNHPGPLAGGGMGFGPAAGGTTVTVNSISAPLLYASATQVAVVVPYAIGGTTAQVQVTYLGDVSNAFTVPVADAAPRLFTSNQSGTGQAAAINGAGGKPNSAANPVEVYDTITLYATGQGQTIPAGVDGKLADSTSIHPVLPVRVTVGGIPALVQYAGSAPGQVAGLMQINVQVPSGAIQPGGYVPVILQVGTAASEPDAVWIAVLQE